jgi:hypothetical protein
MKCSYHSTIDSQEACSVCRRPLCAECTHKIKGKPYCQECLVEGAEWAATVKGFKLPSDAPRRAAFCAIIPGLGAVYNSEYIKAITYFSVFAGLSVMGSRVHGIFGFGSFVFLLFTIFEAYRTAESKARKRIQTGALPDESFGHDRTIIGWGIVLIVLGVIFLLQNFLHYYFDRLWPLIFILLGAYLVYRAIESREKQIRDSARSFPDRKEDV